MFRFKVVVFKFKISKIMLKKILSNNFLKVLGRSSKHFFSKAPVTISVTGAAGQIGYATLFRIASGEMLGKD